MGIANREILCLRLSRHMVPSPFAGAFVPQVSFEARYGSVRRIERGFNNTASQIQLEPSRKSPYEPNKKDIAGRFDRHGRDLCRRQSAAFD
jgi:hypothetical protein